MEDVAEIAMTTSVRNSIFAVTRKPRNRLRNADEAGGSIRHNPIEIESEINFQWLLPEQTGGWLSSHFDVVDQFSPAARPLIRGQ